MCRYYCTMSSAAGRGGGESKGGGGGRGKGGGRGRGGGGSKKESILELAKVRELCIVRGARRPSCSVFTLPPFTMNLSLLTVNKVVDSH